MASDKNISLNVVVGVVETEVTVNTNQTVEHLIKEALRESDQKGELPENWVLRTEVGEEISQGKRIRDVPAITSGVTLFLSQTTGGGG